MSFQRIYTLVRTTIFVGSTAIGTGGFYAFVIAGICRIIFKLEENTALLWIGGPLFILITVLMLIYFPKHLRKAGFIE